MHIKFVEPTKEYADIIFPKGSNNKIAIDATVNDSSEADDYSKSGNIIKFLTLFIA